LEQSQAFHQIAPVKREGEQHKDNAKTDKGGPVEQKWDRGLPSKARLNGSKMPFNAVMQTQQTQRTRGLSRARTLNC